MLEQLREAAGLGGPAAVLANQLLVIRQQYENHELNQDEWILITKQEYELVEATYSEIDEIRRDLKINQILEK